MLQISELYIYPIKSLGGIKLDQALITDRGFEYDRRWMLIDSNNRFISQREVPAMALLNVRILNNHLQVVNNQNQTSVKIPLYTNNQQLINVIIWDDICIAQPVSEEINRWFSDTLGLNCRLVYMPNETKRATDPHYSADGMITSFSDGYPFLIIGQASLDDLNKRVDTPLPINRFRPNIVFTGGSPYLEDTMDSFSINNVDFNGVKLCARCIITTIDQHSAQKGKEPLKTLATYRFKNNKIYFGQNLVHTGTGIINVGDEILVSSTHTDGRFIIT